MKKCRKKEKEEKLMHKRQEEIIEGRDKEFKEKWTKLKKIQNRKGDIKKKTQEEKVQTKEEKEDENEKVPYEKEKEETSWG